MSELFHVSQPPHIRANDDTRSIMLDVVIALMPCLIAGVYFFGYRALVITLISVASAIAFEHLWCVFFRQKTTVVDLSAVVSGMILAMNLPVSVPFWLPVVGSCFMIIVVKMCFGGLGQNFMNPAAAARAFLLASFPVMMTTFPKVFSKAAEIAISSPTPLAMTEGLPSYIDLFLGGVGGCIGETSALAILIGAAYLFARRIIRWRLPVVYIVTVAVFGWLFGGDPLFQVLAGGALFAAVFMVTDYTTTPVTKWGEILFAFGAGLITAVIRAFGGYPEGVTYGILLMNVAAPLLEKVTPPRKLGGARR